MPMSRTMALLRACHPEPTAAVTVVTGLLAVGTGLPAGRAAAVTVTVLASQLAVGWSNDAIDAPRDAASGRTDKPIAVGGLPRAVPAVAAAVAAVATVVLATVSMPGPAAAVATVALVSGLLYNWPLKSTVASVLPYAVSFAALPTVVALAAGHRPPGWLPAAGALIGVGAHFANALPDLADDARTGVVGLPTGSVPSAAYPRRGGGARGDAGPRLAPTDLRRGPASPPWPRPPSACRPACTRRAAAAVRGPRSGPSW
jgi:4-hydroxybenzoate polyprenyltransferase